MLEKKIDTDHIVTCVECGNDDTAKLLIIADAPHVIECMECGHPNDRRHMDDDAFYDMLLDVVM
jgi:Zn ribbon nucleic-acid-binding protein